MVVFRQQVKLQHWLWHAVDHAGNTVIALSLVGERQCFPVVENVTCAFQYQSVLHR
ncbi:MAG: hypothetical protein V3U87_10015 [Methylococcaceae bacterium]